MSEGKKENILLVVRQWEKVLFEGEVKSLSSFNARGPFDILGEHANFISLINNACTIRKLDGTQNDLKIVEGVIHVHENKVTVYVGIIS